jgi:dodecin
LQRIRRNRGNAQRRATRAQFASQAGKSGQFTRVGRPPCRGPFIQENSVSNHVYKHIELTGSSTKNIEDAVSTAIAKASLSVRNIHWFEVVETRGHVEKGKVAHWQVTIKVGFTLED